MTRPFFAQLSTMRAVPIVCGVALACALVLPGTSSAEPKTEDEKTLYYLGVVLSKNLGDFALSPAEQAQVVDGLRSGLAGNAVELDPATYDPKLRALGEERQAAALEREKAAAAAFLEKAGKASGAQVMPSGLIYTEITPGTGKSPGPTDVVKVHYHGTLRDGTVFDSSVQRGTPAEFPLNRVIACWTEGVGMMKEGGKSKLICPPEIAYGDRGNRGIKGGSVLTFEVELLEIVPQ
jgi:FKBP-type peptidyl-prolyl cis-trans isomerase